MEPSKFTRLDNEIEIDRKIDFIKSNFGIRSVKRNYKFDFLTIIKEEFCRKRRSIIVAGAASSCLTLDTFSHCG